MKTILRRFKEPSTWAGLGVIAGAVLPVVGVPVATVAAIVSALGGVAVIVRDPGSPKDNDADR
jgi:hypothetical protein